MVEAANWPAWRGPGGNGVAQGEPPRELEGKLLWKTELPGRACSTPVVWDQTIFVTAPIGEEDGVVALDGDGKERWRQSFGKATPGRGQRVGSSANSSPIVDGDGVVAYFKSGNVVGLTHAGEKLWEVNLQAKYGEDKLWWDQGTSPVFAGGNVVIAVMQTEGDSYLVSLDRKTGKEVWMTPRDYPSPTETGDAYTTPHVVTIDGVETVVTWGADHLTGHDAKTGKLLWDCGGFNPKNAKMWRVIASAVVEDGIAVVPYARGEQLGGVRVGGKGDVTKSNWLWKKSDVGADAVSPVMHEGKVYVLTGTGGKRGTVTCLDAATGEKQWSDRLPKAAQVFYASPLIVGDRFYCVREDGHVFSATLGSKGLEEVSGFELGEGAIASPISVAGKLLIRGDKHLFCFGAK